MADDPEQAKRGRGRPKVAEPRTVTLTIRLRVGEYDAICKRATNITVAEVGRTAIRKFLTE